MENEFKGCFTITIIGKNYDYYDLTDTEEVCKIPFTTCNIFEKECVAFFKAGEYIGDAGVIKVCNEMTGETRYMHRDGMTGNVECFCTTKALKDHLKKYNMELKTERRFVTRDSEAGNIIEKFDTIEEARKAIEEYEEQDKADDVYTPNFYEIYDTKNEMVVR